MAARPCQHPDGIRANGVTNRHPSPRTVETLGPVRAEGRSKIMLSEGDFGVLDANGTDGEASFQLPAPGLDAYVVGEVGDADVESNYSAFIRPLGKPGGSATITTCAELLDSQFGDLLDNRTVRSINNRTDGEAYCSVEQVGTDILTRTKGNNGLRLAQVRFYDCSTNVETGASTC